MEYIYINGKQEYTNEMYDTMVTIMKPFLESLSLEQLQQGDVYLDTIHGYFVVFKANKEGNKVALTICEDILEAREHIQKLNLLNEDPPCFSKKYDRIALDMVWAIQQGKIVNPVTKRRCKMSAKKAGKIIVAYNPTNGPYYVMVPGTGTEEEPDNLDCAMFLQIDDALDFIEKKLWKKPKDRK